MKKEIVEPGHGGCWFCYTKDDKLVYDTEFDTYVHIECIKKVLKENPRQPEAQFMKYLLHE